MEDSWNKSGIYMLTCKVNGKRYIGQSKNIARRLKEHEYESRMQKRCYLIHRAIIKHGWENFDKIVLEFCPIEKLDELEIYYIAKFQPEYNLTKGGESGARGYKHSEKSKKKISKFLIGNNYGSKKVVNVELGQIFESIKLAAKSVGKTRDAIWRSLCGKTQTAGGYHWKFLSDYNEQEKISDDKPYRKSVMCIDTGEIFPSARAAANSVGVSYALISVALNGKCKTAGGFRWKFANAETPSEDFYNDTRKKSIMCIETGEIFSSMKAAADSVGLKNPASISQIFYGKAKTAGGYHWKFIEKETD